MVKLPIDITDRSFNHKLVVILLTALVLWAVWYLHEVILLIFLAVIVAIGISLPAKRFRRYGLGQSVATVASAVLVTGVFLGIVLWLIPVLAREIQNFVVALPGLLTSLQVQFSGTGLGDILDSLLRPEAGVFAGDNTQIIRRFLDNGLPVVFSGAGALVSIVTNLLLVLVVSVMFLIEPKSYVKALLYVVPRSAHPRLISVTNQIYETIRAWLKSLLFSVTFTSIAVFIGMTLVGVPTPAAIAMFAALATFIPNIGAIIPLIPIALFTLTISPELFLVASVVYLGIQLLESNVVTPMVIKQQLNIPVASVLIFQIVAGVVFGLLGVLLAVPLLATGIVIVRELVAKHHFGYQPGELVVTSDSSNHLQLE